MEIKINGQKVFENHDQYFLKNNGQKLFEK